VGRRVLMFSPQFRPVVGGAERQAEKLAHALANRGADVTVLTPRLIHGAMDQEDAGGVKVVRFPLFDLSRKLRGMRGVGPLNLVSLRLQVFRAMKPYLRDAEVVHTHIATTLTAYAMQAAQKAGLPVLCKVAMAGERTDLGELFAIGLGGPSLARSMVLQMNRWVATTEAVYKSLLDWEVSPARISVIPNGVDLVSQSGLRERSGTAQRFLYLGRLSSTSQRDVPSLLRAFDLLADEVPGVELAVVGAGDLYAETESLVSELRNQGAVNMAGEQSPERWLEWADCLVLPSRREGLSNALLEAMSHGVACIANDIGPNREVLSHGQAGVLVEVGNTAALLGAMRRMALDPGVAMQTGKAGYQRVTDNYSIESVAERYMDLYAQLVAESPRG
jgi:glycosyltransferase involved in cell wall biosynthesis